MSDEQPTKITVNGKQHTIDAPKQTPLLWIIREELGLTGTKFGCGKALCGACTVHIDGQAVRSCTFPLKDAHDKDVTTIEGLSAQNETLHAIQKAWIELNVPQCGYCQAGQIMSAVMLLKANPNPTDDDIDAVMSANLCRCGTYQRIRAAIKLAAGIKS